MLNVNHNILYICLDAKQLAYVLNRCDTFVRSVDHVPSISLHINSESRAIIPIATEYLYVKTSNWDK